MELGSDGAAHGTLVVSEVQTGGRGRLSRQWYSPRGGLYMSVILRPRRPGAVFPFLPLAVGVAVIEAVTGYDTLPLGLKWPNDILLDGRKLGGILIESAPFRRGDGGISFYVAGIGLNVNTDLTDLPEELRARVTSLAAACGCRWDMESLMQAIAQGVLLCLEKSTLERGSETICAWQRYDALVGVPMDWMTPAGEVVSGRAIGLAHDGRYMVSDAQGTIHHVLSGDLTPGLFKESSG